MNSHVYLQSFHMFSTLYPEINMLGEISKHFKFMEIHVVTNHVSFRMSFQCHFNMYWSYAIQQWLKVILTKKASDKFLSPGQ